MAKQALVIMAAGIGSRFGGGIKQLEPVGPCGEIIMDYSIHDAIEAGFDKIVIIIRKDIEADFREVIGERIEAVCDRLGVELCYAYQSGDDLPEGYERPADRTKPWGTGHAILACRDLIHEPFVTVNADDYYGKAAYRNLHGFLENYSPEDPMALSMSGFVLANTLSDNGTVTRGICHMDKNGLLTDVRETKNIRKTENGAETDGKVLDVNSLASMNMWGLTPEFMKVLEEEFVTFLKNLNVDPDADPLKAEYLLPILIGDLLDEGRVSVQVLDTPDRWFGVTYKEDKPAVAKAFAELIENGVYSRELYSDLG